MPGLRAFGRRWEIGGDDLVFPQISEALIRVLWFVIMLAVYSLHSHPCEQDSRAPNYILVLLFIYAVTIVLSLLTAHASAQGRILNPNARRRLPALLYARCPLLLFEFCWNITGSVWINQVGPNCDSQVITAVKVTLAGEWILLLVVLIGVWMVFDPTGAYHHDHVDLASQKARKLWKRRLRVVCLCLNTDDHAKNAFEEVAKVLSEFFSDVDLVMTDIWSGLIILAHGELRPLSVRNAPKALTPAPEWMNLALADRMMDFALGIYGWPYYMYNRISPRRWYRLCQSLRFCADCRCDQVLVVRDNCCRCNTAALLLQTGIHEADLFHVSFHNQIYEVPFVACADARTSSIVIAIRGSLSLRDAVTDLCATDESLILECLPDPSNMQSGLRDIRGCLPNVEGDIRVHRGILNTAKYVHSVLVGQKVIEDLLVLYPDFDIVVTGHSLGAGVASVVSLLLRSKYPRIRCFAFSPPGCVLSENCIEETKTFICSVITGDDIIPRLSYHSMYKFRKDIMDAIEHSHQPKFRILLKGCYRVLCGGRHIDGNDYETLEEGPKPPDEPLIRSGSEVSHYTDSRAEASATTANDGVEIPESGCRLRIPGRIMFIKSGQDISLNSSGSHSVWSWEDQEKFNDVFLSSRMLTDHMPYSVSEALKSAVASQGSREETSRDLRY